MREWTVVHQGRIALRPVAGDASDVAVRTVERVVGVPLVVEGQ
jgi:hypothetical protein